MHCTIILQFATVYKARDKTTNTIVAIKKVRHLSLHLLKTITFDQILMF